MTALHDEHATLADLFQPVPDTDLAVLLAAEGLHPVGAVDEEVQGD
ncbi:hypothetical protein ACFWMR_02195 [Amycolatopsis thailandensis]